MVSKNPLAIYLGKIDELHATDNFNQNVIIKDPTGFTDPSAVIINYDPTTQKVTLTGTWAAYWQGILVPSLTTGYLSPAHTNTTGHVYFLYYNGSTFQWMTDGFPGFDMLLIAFVNYGASDKFAIRECHGFMPWQTHGELHNVIGTYKTAGGSFTNYILESTTAADRRLDVSTTTINDEDIPTVNAALISKLYTQYYLGNASVGIYAVEAADVIPLLTNNPYYNTFSTPNWSQTLMPANSVATVWIYAIPVTASTTSQKYKYLFIQPQWITQANNSSAGAIATAVASELLRLPSELNLGTLTIETTEFIAIGRIIISYHNSNWQYENVSILTGNKSSQTGSPSGNFLTAVTTDATLTGAGTGASPLAVNPNLNISTLGVGSTVATSTILDVASTTKGTRPAPSMTTIQRDSISTPATGLLIYNTTTKTYDFYNGTTWAAMGSGGGISLGKTYALINSTIFV